MRVIEREHVDYLHVDIFRIGVIIEAKKITTVGEVHYQELACHGTSSPVSTAAMLDLNLAIPICLVQNFAPGDDYISDVTSQDRMLKDGYLFASDAPGLVIDLIEEATRKNAPNIPHEPPHWRRPMPG